MPIFYQLRVVLRNVSPLIWRRLLVRSDTSIAELHAILQTAMGWSGTHLHRFRLHSKAYGIARCGGIGFAGDPFEVRLSDFRLRRGERFLYEYGCFSCGGGLIQAAVGIASSCGALSLKRLGLARNAASRVAWRVTRMACARPYGRCAPPRAALARQQCPAPAADAQPVDGRHGRVFVDAPVTATVKAEGP